jgi:uncharacterized protein (TIGR02271 family)
MIETEHDKIVRLHSEDLQITRERIAGDTVRVRTVTSQHDRLVEEQLVHERVEIVRVPIGRVVDTVPDVRQDGDVTILPVVEEEIVVQKRLILKEEVHLRRVSVAEVHRETVILREQDAVITRIPASVPIDERFPGQQKDR